MFISEGYWLQSKADTCQMGDGIQYETVLKSTYIVEKNPFIVITDCHLIKYVGSKVVDTIH